MVTEIGYDWSIIIFGFIVASIALFLIIRH